MIIRFCAKTLYPVLRVRTTVRPPPTRRTLLGEIAALVISMFQQITRDEHGVESSVFPFNAKGLR